MGIRGTTCGLRDLRRHHVFRLGSLIGLRSGGASRGCMSGGPRGKIGELSEVTDSEKYCVELCDVLSESPEDYYIVDSELSWRIVL